MSPIRKRRLSGAQSARGPAASHPLAGNRHLAPGHTIILVVIVLAAVARNWSPEQLTTLLAVLLPSGAVIATTKGLAKD
ncbi:hypothetical protein [Catenulispora rubra]|uniref:hypothetical protein n=1 Tax=Catenulispora rubra TaxID=280293 RepID=UPI0018926905|nr:hypothetical protein [Catenulispora rubra]